MRRLTMLWISMTMIVAGSTLAVAHDERGGLQTITGEVVDLACYLDHGALGPGHAECARKCITSGLPVGIKVGETIYLAVGHDHGPANAALAPLAGHSVTAEGAVTEKDGVHLIAISKVTASS